MDFVRAIFCSQFYIFLAVTRNCFSRFLCDIKEISFKWSIKRMCNPFSWWNVKLKRKKNWFQLFLFTICFYLQMNRRSLFEKERTNEKNVLKTWKLLQQPKPNTHFFIESNTFWIATFVPKLNLCVQFV